MPSSQFEACVRSPGHLPCTGQAARDRKGWPAREGVTDCLSVSRGCCDLVRDGTRVVRTYCHLQTSARKRPAGSVPSAAAASETTTRSCSYMCSCNLHHSCSSSRQDLPPRAAWTASVCLGLFSAR